MCGITGVIALTENGRQYLSKIEAGAHALRHRGPDGKGLFRDGNVAFGHTRLAVIDTTNAAAQPFHSGDGRYTIIYNGEIFNFRALRSELKKSGVKFRSDSDTEVLLELFAKEGERCLQRLNGFFAFAVFDKNDGSVFLARDRYGEKPLYVYSGTDALIFASEVKSFQQMSIPLQMDHAILNAYLQLNYVPPGPWSIFNKVAPLKPGTAFHFIPGSRPRAFSYYELPLPKTALPANYENAQKELRKLLEDAVKMRLVADVPLGSFLSGGVDSSIITALAARHKPGLETFSIGFADEPFFDETEYAKIVAGHLETKHHVFTLTNKDLLGSLYEFLENIDEPFADSSALAVNILAKETRKHVTVALSGDGADELFGGYNKHEAELRARQKNYLNFIIRCAEPLWDFLPASRNSLFGNKIRQLRKYANGLNSTPQERYWLWAGYASQDEVNRMLVNPGNGFAAKKDLVENISGGDDLNDILYSDMQLVLPGDMLVKIDRASMLHGLEVRPPFLDHHVVDFVMQLPSTYKIDADGRKKILKETFADLLPAEIFAREKQGFEVPLLKWFRGELRGLIDELLNEKFIRTQGIFKYSAIKIILKQMHSASPGDSVARIWALIVFQTWWKKYFLNS